MTVPVERRFTTFRCWEWAKEDIQSALVAGHGPTATFEMTMDFILPIAAELVRLKHPELTDVRQFDAMVWKVARAMFIVPMPQYDGNGGP